MNIQSELPITIISEGKMVTMSTKEYKAYLRAKKIKKTKAKTLNEIRLLPTEINVIMRNLKVLRSIVAYRNNGYKQWGKIAKTIINSPQISVPLLHVVLKINDIDAILLDIEKIAKKGEKAVYQYVEKLQYKLKDTQSALDKLLDSIINSGVLNSTIRNHECISGTGRRLGLRILAQRGSQAISEIGRIVSKLEQITKKGVDPMCYQISGKGA